MALGSKPTDQSVQLYLGNLSPEVTEEDIEAILKESPISITSLIIRRSPQTQRSRGFAHIEFNTEQEGKICWDKLNGVNIKGRAIRVDWCDPVLRRKYTETNKVESTDRKGTKRNIDDVSTSSSDLLQIFDSDNTLTPAALLAAKSFSISDLEKIMEEIDLLYTSSAGALYRILDQNPSLRIALLHAQLVLKRHQSLDFSNVTVEEQSQIQNLSTTRLLLECNHLKPSIISGQEAIVLKAREKKVKQQAKKLKTPKATEKVTCLSPITPEVETRKSPIESKAPAMLQSPLLPGEIDAPQASEELVRALLSNSALLKDVLSVTAQDLLQFDGPQKLQVLSLRKALRYRGT